MSCHFNNQNHVKGTVHLQKIYFKYVMLRTVTKNSTIIITKYTWYHRYREIIQITRGPRLRLHQKPDLKGGTRELKCSDIISALYRLIQIIDSLEPFQIIFLLSGSFWLILIWLRHSWPNFNKIMPFSSGIIICSHLFTCFCTGSIDFRSTGYAQVRSAFRSFRSLSSFKMAAPTGH